MKKLCIIIPAYKGKYLPQALQSIEIQTDKRFSVYVGDDCSEEDLYSIVKPFESLMSIHYHRFEVNTGRVSLVKQWQNCIDLTNEEYIWLFSDDDIMPQDAVERFWKFEKNHDFDICRFQLELGSKDGEKMLCLEPHPEFEMSDEFIKKRLQGKILSAASEYIFTREIYNKCGFVEFPLAWCSDDASWSQMGEKKGIFTIQGNPVIMRMSGDNISSSDKYNVEKAKACLMFSAWLSNKYIIDSNVVYQYLRGRMSNAPFSVRKSVFTIETLTLIQKVLLLLNYSTLYKLYKYV